MIIYTPKEIENLIFEDQLILVPSKLADTTKSVTDKLTKKELLAIDSPKVSKGIVANNTGALLYF